MAEGQNRPAPAVPDVRRALRVSLGVVVAAATAPALGQTRGIISNRWLQLVVGILGMVMIANLQYGWTLFVNPIDAKHNWGKAAIQVAFSIFVLTETWLVPVEAYLVDRYGPAVMVAIGGVLVAVAWALNSVAASLTMLYLAAAVGGV